MIAFRVALCWTRHCHFRSSSRRSIDRHLERVVAGGGTDDLKRGIAIGVLTLP